jgi:heme-degrading monooxygenase HmoA
VADYGKWKRVVNRKKNWRKQSGEKTFEVYRGSNNPNDLTVICTWDSSARMQKFIKSAELREAMQEAGVISKPDIQFYSKVDKL